MFLSLRFFFLMIRRPPRSTLFPTRRSSDLEPGPAGGSRRLLDRQRDGLGRLDRVVRRHLGAVDAHGRGHVGLRSEEHTSELQSRQYLVCRLLLEKKKDDHKGTNDVQSYHLL